jgi:hypothetical protein
MKAIKYLGFAAVVLLMTACSNDNDEPRLPEQPTMIQFHATIDVPGSATRTIYTIDNVQGKDIVNVAWKAGDKGDEIALIHGGNLDKLIIETVNADGSATVSGTITKPSGDSEAAKLVYPYSAVMGGERTGTDFDYSYLVENNLYSQNGILSDIATKGLDIREGNGTIVVEGNQGRFSSSVAMTSKIILWKFTLKNSDGSVALNATQLKIEVTHDSYTSILAKAVKSSASSEFYMAVPAKIASLLSGGTNTLKITALASDGFNYNYERTKATTLAAGKYYESALKMTKSLATNPAYYAATAGDVGKVIGANGTIYADEAAATAGGTTAVAKIAYVGTASTAFRGLAVALSDDAQNVWGTVVANAANKADAPTGSTWFLPTVLDWQYVLNSNVELNLKSGNEPEYWTGTEISISKAYYYNSETKKFGVTNKNDNTYSSRDCLAF